MAHFTNEQTVIDNGNAWEADYSYDFNGDGVPETLKIKEGGTEEDDVLAEFLSLSFWDGKIWSVIPQKITGNIASVSLWKPYDVVVIQTGLGQYVDSSFFEFRKSTGLRPIPIITDGKTGFSLEPTDGTEFFTTQGLLGDGVLISYFPLMSGCNGKAEACKLCAPIQESS